MCYWCGACSAGPLSPRRRVAGGVWNMHVAPAVRLCGSRDYGNTLSIHTYVGSQPVAPTNTAARAVPVRAPACEAAPEIERGHRLPLTDNLKIATRQQPTKPRGSTASTSQPAPPARPRTRHVHHLVERGRLAQNRPGHPLPVREVISVAIRALSAAPYLHVLPLLPPFMSTLSPPTLPAPPHTSLSAPAPPPSTTLPLPPICSVRWASACA